MTNLASYSVSGFEIEDASGKHIRRDQIQPVALKDLFILKTQKRQRRFPLGLAFLPVGDLDSRVAVSVAFNDPLKSQVDERGRVDYELTRRHVIGVLNRRCDRARTHELQEQNA